MNIGRDFKGLRFIIGNLSMRDMIKLPTNEMEKLVQFHTCDNPLYDDQVTEEEVNEILRILHKVIPQ